LIPFHAGYNRSNPSFFQITYRFDRTSRASRAHLWRYRKDFDGGDRGNNQMAQSMFGVIRVVLTVADDFRP
jgi:hypothetical protein